MRTPKACGDNIVIKLKKVEEVTASGIIIPKARIEREQEAVQEAEVVDIGPEAFKQYGTTSWFNVGDTVVLQKYSGAPLPDVLDRDETYRVVKDIDIWVKLEETL